MTTFTVQIAAGSGDGRTWTPVHTYQVSMSDPPQEGASELAVDLARDLDLRSAPGDRRVRVWNGARADTSTDPDGEETTYTIDTGETLPNGIEHAERCPGDPYIVEERAGGQWSASCTHQCGWEVSGCVSRADAGAHFFGGRLPEGY
jgi:hypothetical protein